MQSDSSPIKLLSMVIPCFNEADRLHFLRQAIVEFDQQWSGKYELILVNDGSSDATLTGLEEFRLEQKVRNGKIEILSLEANQGKGFALKAGVKIARGDYILTLDADMSTHPLVLIEWLSSLLVLEKKVVYIGSRVHPQTRINARLHRVLLGNLFNVAIRMITGIKEGDTQCGFKLYPAHIGKTVFGELVEGGWAHDIELLMRLKMQKIKTISMPVKWEHRPGGSIRVVGDGIGMFFRMLRIAFRLRFHIYRL